MTNTLRLKRSSIAGKVPLLSDLQTGELALNISDRKLFSTDGSTVFEIGGTGVSSVAGKTGSVTLDSSDVGLSNVLNIDTSNASNITIGTLADTRLSSNVALLNATSQTFTGSNTFLSSVTLSNQTEIRFQQPLSNGTFYTALRAPTTLSNNLSLTLPSSSGTSGQVLSTDGTGNLTWSSLTKTLATLTDVALAPLITGNFLRYNGTAWVNSNNGSALTALNATNLTAGTIPDARLSSNVVLLTGAQTISGGKTFSAVTTISNTTNSTSLSTGALVVNGGLAANGTITAQSLNLDPGGTANAGIELGSITGGSTPFIDFHSGTSYADFDARIIATGGTGGGSGGGTLIFQATTFNFLGSLSANSLSGSGSGLTALNASNLTSGTVAPARLGTGTPAANTILFGDGTWALAPAADNLGNHTATTTLNMNGQAISGATMLTVTRAGASAIASASTTNTTSQVELVTSGGASSTVHISFHKPGSFATNFGLDADNQFAFGGWSQGSAYAGIKAGAGTFTGTLNLSAGEFMNINSPASTWRYTRFRNGATVYFDIGLDTSSNYFISRWPTSGGSSPVTFGINKDTGATSLESLLLSGDTYNRFQIGTMVLRGQAPIIYLRDTDHNSAGLHCNSSYFYLLRAGNDSESHVQVGGAWPLQINLTNNDALFGRNVGVVAGDGNGYNFWGENNTSFKIYMSTSTNATWGGRLDTTSDYNIYFRMTGGTNRGWVFHNGTNSVAQIDASGNLHFASTGGLIMSGNTVIDSGGGWHRSYGNTGWYNGTYGGGIYMYDTTWVRTYNGKSFHSEGALSIAGNIVTINGYSPTNGAIRMTPNMHLNAGSTTHSVIVNWDTGNTGGTAGDKMFRVGNGSSAEVFSVRRDGYVSGTTFNATKFEIAADSNNNFGIGELRLRSGSPTIYFRDINQLGCALHCNSNYFYVLRCGVDSETFAALNNVWPLSINLSTNDANFGGIINGPSAILNSTSNQLSLRTLGATADNRRWDLSVFNGDGDLYFQTWTDSDTFIKNNFRLPRAGGIMTDGVFTMSGTNYTSASKGNTGAFYWNTVLPGQGSVEFVNYAGNGGGDAFAFYRITGATSTVPSTAHRISRIDVGGSYIVTSDIRVKDEFKPITNALSIVKNLKPWHYKHYINNYSLHGQIIKGDQYKSKYGFVAQEIEDLVPEAVLKPVSADDLYGMDYNNIIPILTKAIQEQQEEIETMKVTIKILMNKLQGTKV